ncbi:MAG TPA: carboxypeptidase-like regulatory domain-containing protein [Solirubrobacteraceae bacterium]|nr:carboxypeptidase-like regulatory domain-containing protein [Solirubrobacteraceae bacterium]
MLGTVSAPERIALALAILLTALLANAAIASAGSYYIYGCSSYGNTAPAFVPYSNADHLSTADECMQPAPGAGYRSLEINNPPNGFAPVLHGYGANWTANSPSTAISIVGAYTPVNTVFVDCYLHSDGFTAEYFWSSGTQNIVHENGCDSNGVGFGTGINTAFAPSSYFGWGAGCWLLSSCSTSSNVGAVLGVQGIRLTAQENSPPGIVADGSNNLWYQGGHWIRGGGWPAGFTATDPSGVCRTDFLINGGPTPVDQTNDPNPDTSSFTQCWGTDAVSGTVDTSGLPNGPMSITLSATNAAGVTGSPTETLQVDNTPVSLLLLTPKDADPNAWVNHAVKVVALATAGPSGIAGTVCSTNHARSYAYPSNGIVLNATGVWTISCSSWNNSLDVNGQPAASSTSVSVHLDETPPRVAFAPANPSDPQAVVAPTSDGQSGVAGGTIRMRPASGGNWQDLTTQFTGSQLTAHFDDISLAPGKWLIEADSCDKAGNCAAKQETLTLPVRSGSTSSLAIGQANGAVRACTVRRARHHRHRKHESRSCHDRVRITRRVAYGKRVVVEGRLTTSAGAPIPSAPISILAAANNGLSDYRQAASAKTDATGAWSVTLPAGPSRLISAVYSGSATIQSSRADGTVTVPAEVRVLRVWPRHVKWGGRVHVEAQLLGGFLPPGGALVRLRLGYGNAKITYGVREHVGGNGRFEVTNRFGPGPPGLIRHYWLQECSLPESDYPFAAACGARSAVSVGG